MFVTSYIFWFWVIIVSTLQVLCGWRRWVTEQQINQAQAAGAAQANRDEPLMEDVKCFLTSAAHMKDVTAGLTGNRQEQVHTSVISQFKELIIIIIQLSISLGLQDTNTTHL